MGNNTKKQNRNLHKNSLIDIKEETQNNETKNKNILFLGTADSGKSTLFNRIRNFENNIEINDDNTQRFVVERLLYILVYYFNIFSNDSRCQSNYYKFILDIVENKISFEQLYNENKNQFTKENLFTKLKENSNRFNEDNIVYFLNNWERILLKKETTELDYFSSYCTTTGIMEYNTLQNNKIFTAGGQRSVRKKWIHIFENVSTLVIFVSLSEFNQTLYEDESTNRLKESLELFSELFNSKWFTNVNTLLVFTKVDCFIRKINGGIKMSNYFNDFTGNDFCPKEVFEFIVEKFKALCIKKELRYCALNCLDKLECLKVKEIIENINNYKNQNEMFISSKLILNVKEVNQMMVKLYQSIANVNYCDIDIKTFD